ncbi:hypothetical protein GCM10009753_33480 [Streptantibioticus ferralitis]
MNACEHRSGASAPAVTLITSCLVTQLTLRRRAARPPRRLDSDPVRKSAACPRSTNVLEVFFEALLALVVVAVIAFTGLSVKKLFQGQR